MGKFNLHFFKEKTRTIDLVSLIMFLESLNTFHIDMNEEHAKFTYTHPTLGYKADFIITPKSQVPSIYRLNPRFLDLNFHVEFPILTPNYIAKDIFAIVKKICDRYDFFIYSEFFEDVLSFKMDIVVKVFGMVKHAFIEKNPNILKNHILINSEQLSSVLRYSADLYELQTYYREKNTHVPIYQVLRHQTTVFFAIEWYEGTLTVFPPHTKYILFNTGKTTKTVDFDEIYPHLDKLLEDVPGFIRGTKVVTKKNLKKITKIFRKYNEKAVIGNFSKIILTDLID